MGWKSEFYFFSLFAGVLKNKTCFLYSVLLKNVVILDDVYLVLVPVLHFFSFFFLNVLMIVTQNHHTDTFLSTKKRKFLIDKQVMIAFLSGFIEDTAFNTQLISTTLKT